jgi:hypothetical protein
MKNCADCDPDIHEGGCNWLDWMAEEAGGACPHCGGPLTEIETVTPLGRLMDAPDQPQHGESEDA